MLNTYLKVALRNLWKNRLYTSINIFGLAIGMAACLLIVLYVRDELSYDKHFEDSERIYRITGAYNQGGDAKTYSAITTYRLMPVLAANFAELDAPTRFSFFSTTLTRGDRHIWQEDIALVDSTFFDLFSFQSILGEHSKVLHDPNSIVLTKTASERHFGENSPLGQTIEIMGHEFQVGAVVNDLPSNTHFNAEVFVPMATAIDWYGDWVNYIFNGTSHYLYFKVQDGVSSDELETRINAFLNEKYPDQGPHEYFLQGLESIHLNSNLVSEIQANGNETTVWVFISTAIVILLLAGINYINLALAAAFKRGREVGVKKVLGAKPVSQLLQFQVESLFITFVASVVAVILIEIALPSFNQLTNKSYTFEILNDLALGAALFGTGALIGLVSGSFPALFLLKLKASEALKGSVLKQQNNKFSLRNGLVVFQFLIAVVLIASTGIIINQVKYLRNKDLGIDTEQMLIVPFQNGSVADQYEVMREELLRNPSIVSISASNNHLANRVGNWRGYRLEEGAERVYSPTVIVSHDFFETMGAEMVEGRTFDREFVTDANEAYVINEAAVKFFQFDEPIGQYLEGLAYTGEQWSIKKAKVVGVVKNFHFASLHDEIRPVVFSLSSEQTIQLNYMNVRISPENIKETLAAVEAQWQQQAPEMPFRFEFMDDVLDQHYQAENQFLKVFTSFAALSIVIGCLGLFGLTGFIMKQRTKEIGIRKVLGARIPGLVGVLSKDFLQLVLVANILGWPLAYYFMDKWLQNFAYKISISFWVFLATGVLAMLIAFLSVTYHSIKTASTNPVNSIRYE